MPEVCVVCGKKIGWGFDSVSRPKESAVERGKKAGVYQDGMCNVCLGEALDKLVKEARERERAKAGQALDQEKTANIQRAAAQFVKEKTGLEYEAVKGVFITPAQKPAEAVDLGLVTGYCVLGTGPASSVASSWTDLFGKQSAAYLDKIDMAEEYALVMLRAKTLKMGGSAVYNVCVNLTEATAGHGMLMVSVSGSAVK